MKIVRLGIAAAAVLVTELTLAHSIVLTELSPTTLTATYDGNAVAVTPGAVLDTWEVTFSTVDFHVVVHPPSASSPWVAGSSQRILLLATM